MPSSDGDRLPGRALVLVEHDGRQVRRATRSAVGFARSIVAESGGSVACLVIGHNVEDVAAEASTLAPTLVVDRSEFAQPLADRYAKVIAKVVTDEEFDVLVGASTTMGKDVLGRAAGLLGGAMAGDVVGHEVRDGRLVYHRPMFAGSVLATVQLEGWPQVVTVRQSAYPAAEGFADPSLLPRRLNVEVAANSGSEWLGVETRNSDRPDLADAQVVVSGGRAFKSTEDFERLVGGLADVLQAAVGSTRALVDSGITPNDMQVGQTGKVVAPRLYFALGVSGAIQHLAGMKNSRTIVAINSDPEAPIFQIADYGMVGDVYVLVPELIAGLRERQS